ncbi:MAG TPA: radical SAM protein, partial [Acidimicrobiales bacterium]|nr:radical SAM protein [Acidimicrobiales bacterium]
MRISTYATVVQPDDDTTAVHSGVAGELVMLPTRDWTRVQAFCAGTDDGAGLEDRLHALVRARVLIDESLDELAVLRSRYQRSRYTGKLGLTVVTSLGCNFDCPYCFEEKHPSKLKPAVADAIVAVLEDSPDNLPGVHVTWMGGEPLLGAEELFALSTRLRAVSERRGFPYSADIVTNGWYLDAAMAARLAEHGVRGAQVTIDGPPDVHDRYRPHVNGGSTYERVVANVVEAAPHLRVGVRVNVDRGNLGRVEELIADLAARGLAGRIGLGVARMTSVVANPGSPVATYGGTCFTSPEFGAVEIEFDQLAARYGFSVRPSPGVVHTPCTAVRSTDVVVGADGELWKCWDDIGDAEAAIGTIFEYASVDADGVTPWLAYDPFSDPHCSTCIALPGCMGGCAHHLFHGDDPLERCGSFRTNH